ncbi:MAG: pitrilysin family protein [Proteobacteria bacterium]|nr:pitrilysin family protein [Pseudomonadota bacterium]
MNPIRRVLPSGVEVLVAPRHGAKVVSVQIYVWAGSLHENANEKGAAHFIEHMLFKGTTKRKVGEIGTLIEAAGGDINAYTTFDRTVYYLTLPSSSLKLAVDVLSDAVLFSTFDPGELEREREVILEEIRRGNDDPGSLVGKKIFSLMYPGTEAGRPIIGSTESVSAMSRDDLMGFYQRHYVKPKISLVIVGDVDPETGFSLAEEFLEKPVIQNKALSSFEVTPVFRPQLGGGSSIILGDYQQTRVEIAFPGPSMTDLDGLYVDLAAYILGGSEMSRLQKSLRDRDGLVTAIGCSAYSPSFRGVVEMSATVEGDGDQILKAISGVGRELATFLKKSPATTQEVERARAAFKINRIHREETVDGVARAVGLSLMTPLKERFEDVYDDISSKATTTDVMNAMNRWFDPNHLAVVVLGSNNLKLKESDLKKAFDQGWNEISDSIKSKKSDEAFLHQALSDNVQHLKLNNGVKLIYRHLPDAKMFSLMATTEGGLRFEKTESAGMFHATAGMLGLASKNMPYEKYTGRLEDLGSVVSGFSGKDSCGWEVHSILENVEETLGLWCDGFLNPVIPEDQWASQKRETLHSIKMQQDSASYRCMRLMSQELYGDHPYGLPVVGWPEAIQNFEATGMTKFYHDWRDQGPWVIASSGAMNADDLLNLLNKKLASWKPNLAGKRVPTGRLSPRTVDVKISNQMDKEQAHIAIAWKGINWSDTDRPALDVLINILGGHGGRLFVKLRDEQSLAYSVSPLSSQGVDAGIVGAYIACNPEKIPKAIEGMEKELRLIANELVTKAELDRSKQHIIGSHEINLQRTSSQAMTMGLMDLYGLGWDDYKRYPAEILKVKEEDILRVAKRFFSSPATAKVVVGQQKNSASDSST